MTTMSWLFGLFSVGVLGFALGITVGRILGTLETRRRERSVPSLLRTRAERNAADIEKPV
jgi:hypothetical protein